MSFVNEEEIAAPQSDARYEWEPLTEAAVNTILDVYKDQAYQEGYARATRDVLALYRLLIEEFLAGNSVEAPELRRSFRKFGEYIELTVDHRLTEAGYVRDGLGI